MKSVDYDELDGDDEQRYTLDGVPFTGIATEHYRGGQIRSKTDFVNGLMEGNSQTWYEDGQLESFEVLLRGGAHGLCRYWHRNGQLSKEGTYEHGICIDRREWDETGHQTIDYKIDVNSFSYKLLEAKRG